MPSPRGKVRRPNVGKGATKTTSVSFSKTHFEWLEEQSTYRNLSFALVVAEAIELYKGTLEGHLTDVERADRKAKREAKARESGGIRQPQESVEL